VSEWPHQGTQKSTTTGMSFRATAGQTPSETRTPPILPGSVGRLCGIRLMAPQAARIIMVIEGPLAELHHLGRADSFGRGTGKYSTPPTCERTGCG
jgi:hypothetical protein